MGADESLRFGPDGTELYPAEHYPLQTLTVHHTAGANDDPDPAATVRAIYYYDTITQAWGDMGYHFLIDEAGTVYEGRWPRHRPGARVRPGPWVGRPAADGQRGPVSGYIAGNIGVVLMGDLTNTLPTPAARQSLTSLLAVLVGAGRLDPVGVTDYVNPANLDTRRVTPSPDTATGRPPRVPATRSIPSCRRCGETCRPGRPDVVGRSRPGWPASTGRRSADVEPGRLR